MTTKQHDLHLTDEEREILINTLESVMTDNAKLRSLAGETRVPWKVGIRRMIEARHPDWLRG